MPHILLKRTFKEKERKNEKALSFHGPALNAALMGIVNERVATGIKYSGSAKLLTFAMNKEGHYYAPMNHDFQKSHEEDAIAIILDVMEEYGWTLKTEYSAYSRSDKGFSTSETQRDIFVFHQPAGMKGQMGAPRSAYAGTMRENVSAANIRFE